MAYRLASMHQPIRLSRTYPASTTIRRVTSLRRGLFVALAWALMICTRAACLAQDSPSGAESPVDAKAEPAAATSGDVPVAEHSEAAVTPAAAKGPVNFQSDIQPIFARHCLMCHGPEKRTGGLRLDAWQFADAGGDSGKPILSGMLETNELVARVTSSDRSYRMPKNAPPLSAQEIADIKRWVSEGCPWPAANNTREQSTQPFYIEWLQSAGKFADRHKSEILFAQPFAIAFLAFQIAILAISRAKVAYKQGRPWATGRAERLCRYLSAVTGRELGLIWLLSIAAGATVLLVGHDRRTQADLVAAQAAVTRQESPWARTPFGYPPAPIRPDQPKQLAGTYYRGNCERNPALFNNGNYLTATFRISICDSKHQAVQVGDPIPMDGLFVRMELERAPGTTDALYTKEMIESVFLSKQFFESVESRINEPVERLETLEEGRRWVAYFPVGQPSSSHLAKGLIYVYTGRADAEMARGNPHYAIQFDLQFDEGKLTAASDLWMNSFGNNAVEAPQQPGKIPYREWFDYRPLPIIEGENSTDPKLLGIEEYERQGLITPSGKQPANKSPASSETPQNDE
jgi:mono/diheme cytochrome c family protein